ncbi:multimeric flavodoxin WrbA [Lachnospiraceae bacterium PFB1-21]
MELIRLAEKKVEYCRACDFCMKNNGVCAQMKTFIDRTYPIWEHLGEKEVYYIVSAGLDEDIIKRSVGDLDGFVEHFEQYEIKGRIYASNVMDAGKVCETPFMDAAYQMGYQI